MELASAGLVCVCVAGWERRAFGGEQAYRSAWTAASEAKMPGDFAPGERRCERFGRPSMRRPTWPHARRMARSTLMTAASSRLLHGKMSTIEPFGARVDLDLCSATSAACAEEVRLALDTHGLLIFRRQAVAPDDQLRVARWFGDIFVLLMM